jgi:hypothetical protein
MAAVFWEPQEQRLARGMVVANRRYAECKASALSTFYAVPAGADAELRAALQRHPEYQRKGGSLTLDDIVTVVVHDSDASTEGRLRKEFDHDSKKFIHHRCQREEDEVEVMRLALRLSRQQ